MSEVEPVNEQTILHRLRETARREGGRPCVNYGEQGKRLSYAEFDSVTDSIAAGLTRLGVKRGDRVSVVTGNVFVAARSIFGIWKCGAIYCPINVNLNREQIQYQVDDCAPSLLLSDIALLKKVRELVPSELPLVVHMPQPGDHDFTDSQPAADSISELTLFSELLGSAESAPEVSAKLSDETAVIYTSGTTGPPKGVVQTHGWLRGLCQSLQVWTHPDDVIYSDLPMHHIGGAFSMFGRAIWCGSSVSLWDRFSPGEFWHRINSGGVSVALLIDVMVNWIFKQPVTANDVNNPLAKVHVLPLPVNHREIAQRFGFDFFIAGYGSSELGNAFSGFIDEFPDSQGTPASLWKGHDKTVMKERLVDRFGERVIISADEEIGQGCMGVSVGTYRPSVEDDEGNTLGACEQGQLVLEPQLSWALFSHYLNKPEQTAESIVAGRFHSSDIVARDENDVYYFKDRKQGFIRVRGENVSATSIEVELLRHPGVFQAAVVAMPALEGAEDDIAAFIVRTEQSNLTPDKFQNWIADNVPKFMRPRFLRFVEELPVTTTMKVEKYKLREMLLQDNGG